MMHSRTIKIHGYSQMVLALSWTMCRRLQTYTWPTARPSQAMIIAEMPLSLSWVMLLKIICEHRILNSRTMEIYDYTWDGAYVVMGDGCYLKFFAKVRMSHYSTIRIYDYSSHGLYVTMDEAVWNRSGKSTRIHGRLQDRRNLWLCLRWCAQCHGWCYLKSIAKARITHSRTIESMIIAETVLTLSWTILFEIACESTHDPLQEH